MKKYKRLLVTLLPLLALVLLSGCVAIGKDGTPTGEGWVYNLLVAPMGKLITYFAVDQKFGFGLGVILTTIIVRLIIFPLGLFQAWKASEQAVRREHLKPSLDVLQERIKKAASQEEQMHHHGEFMAFQKEHGLSMLGGIGCLPLLIQMPFFTAIFYAAKFTPGITEATFLGIDLGKPSLLLTALVAALYLFQSYLSMQAIDPDQREQMKTMMYMSPLMIAFFSFTSPAGVTLYWVVGGFIQIIQQVIVNHLIRPRHKRIIAEEYKKNPPKMVAGAVSRPTTKRDVTPSSVDNQAIIPKKKRNAGKQRTKR